MQLAMAKLYFLLIVLLIKYSHQDLINLIKCCPFKSHVNNDICVPSSVERNFSDVLIYDEDLRRTNEIFQDVFNLIVSNVTRTLDLSLFDSVNLVHDGSLRFTFTLPNAFPRVNIFDNTSFCIDYVEDDNSTNVFTPNFWEIQIDENEDPTENNYYVISALLISCIFLSLIIVVYSLIPELRNTSGKILMAYVFSLLGAFLSLATTRIILINNNSPTHAFCFGSNFIICFFFLSCFCWMTVMAFQIWRSFRKIIKHDRKTKWRENIVLMRCCIFAWGFPILLSTFIVVIDQADLTEVPWFIKPNILQNGCFLSGKEKILYFYVPMMILLIFNCIFFLMTACNMWHLYENGCILNKESRMKSNINRLIVFLKISLIMGVSWVLEVISAIYPEYLSIWYITDTYNMLIGVTLFVSFVCKKKIWHRLFHQRNEMMSLENNHSIRLRSISSTRY